MGRLRIGQHVGFGVAGSVGYTHGQIEEFRYTGPGSQAYVRWSDGGGGWVRASYLTAVEA